MGWASTTYKKEVVAAISAGANELGHYLDVFVHHTNYKSVQVKLPYIEFKDAATGDVSTIISGKGVVVQWNTTTGHVPG